MMTNMFFSLSKLIWQGLDFVIEKLYEGAAMNELIHQFFTFSDTIYSKIYDPIGAGLSSCMCYIYLLFVYLEETLRKNGVYSISLRCHFQWFGLAMVVTYLVKEKLLPKG